MLGLTTFLLRLKKKISLKLEILNPFFRIALFVLVALAISMFVSALINPDWLSDYRSVLNLFGTAIVFVVGVVGGFFQLFIQVWLDYRSAQKSYRAFERKTNNSILALDSNPRGIPNLISRDEIPVLLDHINGFKAVVLTGEAGAGKSKIAVDLVRRNLLARTFCILLDARMLAGVNNSADLKNYFDIDESAYEVVARLGEFVHTVLIVDQIDNIVGTQSCNILIEFLMASSKCDGVSVVAVSRRREANEQGAIRPLLDSGFNEVVCAQINPDIVIDILSSLGKQNPSAEFLNLAGNLLNLDIICEIIRTSNIEDVEDIEDDVVLWEQYRVTLYSRENQINNNGEEFIREAVRLAQRGLASADRCFNVSFPLTQFERRLISGNIISQIAGRKYQFRHDKLQDYLYAWDACERNLDFDQVISELGGMHLRNIFLRMIEIYQLRNAPEYGNILDEVLSG